MIKNFKFAFAIAAFALTAGFNSCSSDDPKEGTATVDVDNPNVGETPTTPAEEKAFIETTATQLQNTFKPQDQAEAVEFFQDIAEEFEDFGGSYNSYPYSYAIKGIRHLGEAVRKADVFGITRAVKEISYSFADISGVYEPDFKEGEWEWTANSSNIEFRFKVKGQDCSLIGVPEGGSWTASMDGYYEEDTYPYEEYPAKYTVTVPAKVTITLSKGSKAMATAVVVNNYDQNGMTAAVDVDATVANINVKATADLNNSVVTAHAVATVGGKEIVNANGALNGHNLCDLDNYMRIYEDYDDDDKYDAGHDKAVKELHSLFSNGSVNANVMQRMFIAGACDSMPELFDKFFDYDDEDKGEVQGICDFANNHIKAQFYLGGAKEPSGDFVWSLQREAYGWGNTQYEYWYPEPVMKFNSDGTTYRFSEYFNDSNFGSTIQGFMSLVDLYESFFGL